MKDFHHLMEELSEHLDVELIPDKHNACVLNFNEKIKVQIEPDAGEQTLFLASEIAEIPAGKYREHLLELGLKFNGQNPRIGTFAYLARRYLLIYFHSFELERVHAKDLAELLPPFVITATLWKESVIQGAFPQLELAGIKKKPSIFEIGK